MDKIVIRNLEVFGNHGVLKEENILGQKFLVSVTLELSTRQAGIKDDLTKSVHYGDVCHFIKRFMDENTFQLIEAAAEHLAREILCEFTNLKAVELEIKKPWAPIGLPIENVSVIITRAWHTAFLAFGSNMGDKKAYIENAIQKLREDKAIRVSAVSDRILTKPYGMVEQDDFVNGCMEIQTYLNPFELLDKLHELENEANRERIIRWGPRTLDLDIIFYDDEIIETKDLIIPHPDMQNRNFVLEPMVQLAPYKRHPLIGKNMKELLAMIKD